MNCQCRWQTRRTMTKRIRDVGKVQRNIVTRPPGNWHLEPLYTNCDEMMIFLQFVDTNPVIRKFLEYDCCYRLADKYLIAMVFVYFKRAKLYYTDHTYLNFFAALCLAHSMEEEDEDLCSEIYPWAVGSDNLGELVPQFLELKLHLWQAMQYRAAVSYFCCMQVFSLLPCHRLWARNRSEVHAGAPRDYMKAATPPRGHSLEYDMLTNSCARCRAVEKTIIEYARVPRPQVQETESPPLTASQAVYCDQHLTFEEE